MALTTNVDSFSSLDGKLVPPVDAQRILPVTWGPAAAVSGEQPEYLPGTLAAYDTVNKYYVAWDPAGANGVEVAKGILWPSSITPENTGGDNKIGLVMVGGTIRLEDIIAGVGVTATPTQIKDAVSATFRGLGILVQDNNEVR